MGLQVPQTTSGRLELRIADGQVVKWKEGEMVIIDDSFEHELWYLSDDVLDSKPRLILIIDLWHPDLSVEEKRRVPGLTNGKNIDASTMTTKAYLYANSLSSKNEKRNFKDEL